MSAHENSNCNRIRNARRNSAASVLQMFRRMLKVTKDEWLAQAKSENETKSLVPCSAPASLVDVSEIRPHASPLSEARWGRSGSLPLGFCCGQQAMPQRRPSSVEQQQDRCVRYEGRPFAAIAGGWEKVIPSPATRHRLIRGRDLRGHVFIVF